MNEFKEVEQSNSLFDAHGLHTCLKWATCHTQFNASQTMSQTVAQVVWALNLGKYMISVEYCGLA